MMHLWQEVGDVTRFPFGMATFSSFRLRGYPCLAQQWKIRLLLLRAFIRTRVIRVGHSHAHDMAFALYMFSGRRQFGV